MEGCYTQHDLWYGGGSGSSSSHDRRSVSLEVQTTARPFVRTGQGSRAENGKSVLSCPRENEREGVRMHEARRFATPMRLLDVSLSTRIDRNRGSLVADRYHIIIGTRP